VTSGSEPDSDGPPQREPPARRREQQVAQGAVDAERYEQPADDREYLADERDDAAQARDDAALKRRERAHQRDVAATDRDRRSRELADDADPGFPDRFLSGRDVDASAGDRADALGDERQARGDREHARADRQRAADDHRAATRSAQQAADQSEADLRTGLEGRTVIGQAQGILMTKHGVSADEAFGLLAQASQSGNVKVRDVAARIVRETWPG
jgi:hypothetical protein